MAWWDLTMACGHDERHQIYGRNDDRPAKAERITHRNCERCRSAAAWERSKLLDTDEAAQAAVESATSHGWAELQGSRKQVAWASQIREQLMTLPMPETTREKLVKVVSAPWWIDKRHERSSSALLR